MPSPGVVAASSLSAFLKVCSIRCNVDLIPPSAPELEHGEDFNPAANGWLPVGYDAYAVDLVIRTRARVDASATTVARLA
ncbi:hypothetical protein [Kribbella sp. CA-247076]|uniref:hypothetical protein n=1 Tax=Kribbella sp. CA-247076 TaxID=3239941 RepID=UPI003D901889